MSSKNHKRGIVPIESLDHFWVEQLRTVKELLDTLLIQGVDDTIAHIAFTNGIEAWQETRDKMPDGDLKTRVTEFIEKLYEGLNGTHKRVIRKLRDELRRLQEID